MDVENKNQTIYSKLKIHIKPYSCMEGLFLVLF